MSTLDRETVQERNDQVARVLKEADLPEDPAKEAGAEVDIHPDRTRENRTPGFTRMRTEWRPEDAAHIQAIKEIVDNRVLQTFADAYQVMYELYGLVREPEYDPRTGEVLTDRHGLTIHKRSESGLPVEDYSRMTRDDKERILFMITTRLFAWEAQAADAWAEAMFAKAEWEERFSAEFVNSNGKTVEDRTQGGRRNSLEERYFAIFQTTYSRKADAIVRTMTLLGQRLKDILE